MQDEEKWFGVFQAYRPTGAGVEEVFAGVEDAADHAERIRSVCRACRHAGWERDAYFVVRSPQAAEEGELLALGRAQLQEVNKLALLGAVLGTRTLQDRISEVKDVRLVSPADVDFRAETHLDVWNGVDVLLLGLYDYADRLVRLREGFYSVACDQWLGWYLQWPYFRKRTGMREMFRPYFDLWVRGVRICFRKDAMCLVRPEENGQGEAPEIRAPSSPPAPRSPGAAP